MSAEERAHVDQETREHLVWEKVWRERRARERRAAAKARVRAHLTEVREAFAAEDAYRNKLRRERLARERQAAEEEEPPAKPEQ